MLACHSFAQSGLDKAIKSGEILVNGLLFLKDDKAKRDSRFVEHICVKNKLDQKITFTLTGKGPDGEPVTKTVVVQQDGKECLLEVDKGIYTYEILFAGEVYKKGDYRFGESQTITIKKP
jgi:hypothetical protein